MADLRRQSYFRISEEEKPPTYREADPGGLDSPEADQPSLFSDVFEGFTQNSDVIYRLWQHVLHNY